MAASEGLSWKVLRVAGENAVAGTLAVEEGALSFHPGKGHGSEGAAWSFDSGLAEVADVAVADRTLKHWPWSVRHGIRIRTSDGSQATFYLAGRARAHADLAVASLDELVGTQRGIADATETYVDHAENAPESASMKRMRQFQRFSWLIGAGSLVIFIPELVAGLREAPGLGRAWVLIYPGAFIAIGINAIVGRFANLKAREHPLLAVLPLTSYLVGVSILAWVIYAFYEIRISAALAPLLFGIPAAFVAALALSPGWRRQWREARDNDKRAS